MVSAVRRDLDDVAERIGPARVRGVHFVGRTLRVVGQVEVDLAGRRVHFGILGPVHLGGAEVIGGEAGVDQDIALVLEAEPLGEPRARAVDERQPLAGPVGIETGNVKRAGIEEVLVGGAVLGIDPALGDEAVDIVEALVVALIDDEAAVLVDDVAGPLVLEAAHGRALDRDRGRIERIDLDHPAEAIDLVRLLRDVEAVMEFAPGIPLAGGPVAAQGLPLGRQGLGGGFAPEVAVEVLLAGEPRSPRRHAAGAVVEHAAHGRAGGIARRLEAHMARGGSGKLDLGLSRDAARVLGGGDDRPAVPLALHLEHRAAVRHHLGVDDVLGHACEVVVPAAALSDAAEHQLAVRVLVIDDEQAVIGAPVERHEAEKVVVVAELLSLGGGRDTCGIEGWSAVDDRLSPADQHVGPVAFGDVMRLVACDGELGKIEAGGRALACRFGSGERARGDGGAEHGRGEQPLHEVAPRQALGDDVADRRIGARVRAQVLRLLEPYRQRSFAPHRCPPRPRPYACPTSLCES